MADCETKREKSDVEILSEMRSEYNCFYENEELRYRALSNGIHALLRQRHGRWIKLYAGNYKCSECGDWWGNDDNEMLKDFSYCPNCGAQMDLGEEE
jgi:predicted RNA-binding Zn-ribbon protein involved in translation (DUF1610 family)